MAFLCMSGELLGCIGIPPSFSSMFSKGDNFLDFLLAYLEDEVFPKWGLFLKERICSMGANSFSYEMTPIIMSGNNENDRVALPESIPIHFNCSSFLP